MEATPAVIAQLRESLGPLAELPEVKGLIDLALQQQQKLENQQQEIEALKEELRKLKDRTSANSSVPPSQDLLKKPSRKSQKPGKKRGPKYDHPGSTRNGFGQADHVQPLKLEACPVCEGEVKEIEQAPVKRQQVAELVERPVQIWEYERPKYRCSECGWSGYGPLPWGVKEGFSYGAKLSSVIGWLGYGGNLTWHAANLCGGINQQKYRFPRAVSPTCTNGFKRV